MAPNMSEILATVFAVLANASDLRETRQWAADVHGLPTPADGGLPDCAELKMQRGGIPGVLAKPLFDVFNGRAWEQSERESIAVAMKAWHGLGRQCHLTPQHIADFLNKPRAGPKLQGSKNKHGPIRAWCPETVIGVATLIKKNYSTLQRALRLDVPAAEVPSIEEELAAAQKEVQKIPALQTKLDTALAAVRQAKKRAGETRESKTAAKARVRSEEKEKYAVALKERKDAYNCKLQQLTQQGEEDKENDKIAAYAELGGTIEEQRVGLNNAHAEKRQAIASAEKLERKVVRLEKKITALEEASSSEGEAMSMDEDETLAPFRLPFELMPRRDEATGRWQAESPELRAVRWAQSARGVHPTTVSHNIQDVLELIAPGLEVPGMSDSAQRQLRTEVTLAGEAMAAWKFASCVRVLSFGWDESTKFGNGVFSCNMQVKNADGSIEDICLRGLSVLPDGGKSVAVLKHIEERIFAHSRRLLTGWKEGYEKANGEGSWARAGGPSPENIGLHRLAEDTVLMTDTCAAARTPAAPQPAASLPKCSVPVTLSGQSGRTVRAPRPCTASLLTLVAAEALLTPALLASPQVQRRTLHQADARRSCHAHHQREGRARGVGEAERG
jgi:hypothetical protein